MEIKSLLFLLFSLIFVRADRVPIKLVDNGYIGVTIAIGRDVPDNDNLVAAIKDVFTRASAVLFRATKYRAYFSDVTILLPETWLSRGLPAPRGQSFARANIVVDLANPSAGNRPYTHQVGECGTGGEYTHLTPEFLTNTDKSYYRYGALDKAIVHEWGHLRWGLFDEYPQKGERQFYRYRKQVLPVQCTKDLTGVILNSETFEKCTYDKETLEVAEDCRYYPHTENVLTGSMMYMQYLPSVVDFCDDEDLPSLHNLHAPNTQNRKCNSMTSWGVMRKHEDFINGRNPPLDPSTPTTPRFTLVQDKETRISLVVDVSHSMTKDDRLQKMNQAARNYISTVLVDGTQLGMVEFAGHVKELVPLTRIKSSQDRLKLMENLPTITADWTSIGAGLEGAIAQLSAQGMDPSGQHIIIITDGEETKEPFIEDVLPKLVSLGIVVDTVGISEEASISLAGLSGATGGNNYFYSARDDDTSLDEALIVSASGGVNASILIHSISAVGTVEFSLDNTVGASTVITINGAVKDVQLLSPAKTDVILEKRATIITDTATDSLQIELNGLAEAGVWKLQFSKIGSIAPRILVQSKARSADTKPITLRSWISRPSVIYSSGNHTIIYAQVRQGYTPIYGAEVFAEVQDDNGIVIKVSLKDSGVYPDLHRADGVYSGSLLVKYLSSNGRYPIRVRMTSTPATMLQQSQPETMIHPVLRNGEAAEKIPQSKPIPMPDLMRTTTAGVVALENYNRHMPVDDVIAPSRIENLDIVRVFVGNQSAIISWTEPGDDFNAGQVTSYVWRMAETYEDLNDTSTRTQDVTSLVGPVWTVRYDGNHDNADVRAMLDLSSFTNERMFYVSVIGLDKKGNAAKGSNIVALSFEEPEASAFVSAGGSDKTVIIVVVTLNLLLLLALILCLLYRKRKQIAEKLRVGPQTQNGPV